jgi:myxalamid-type polyketide synthase MxaE and MxaD
MRQDWTRFERVLAPKVAGAWNLHTLTQHQPLDFFVLFSSAVSILGSPGQGNHAAACAFEDAFAHYRRALGLTALSINWGPWAEIGAAVRQQANQRLQTQGFQTLAPRLGTEIFEDLLRQGLTQIVVISADWSKYFDSLPALYRPAFFSGLVRRPLEPQKAAQAARLSDQLDQARPNNRKKLLLEFVRSQAVKLLGLDPEQAIDDKQPLNDLGLDSLMAVELRSLLSA